MKTKPEATHTPTPWKFESASTSFTNRGSEQLLWNGDGMAIGRAVNPTQATFIVRAVNAHEELLAMLKVALENLDDKSGGSLSLDIKEAIAKAEGK